ncbi:alpha beta hydrolase fold family [Diplocarpon rosae]|nr:alpha beta hydrolase fold family [Diplocarpon rosae]
MSPFEANTSRPMLFIGNTADNVTPIHSAFANAAGFLGSVVIIQDSYGPKHPLTLHSPHSPLLFQTGTLPRNGTVCTPDLVPFEPWDPLSSSSYLSTQEEKESQELNAALKSLVLAPIPSPGVGPWSALQVVI